MPDPKSQTCRKCHQVIRTAKGGLAKHRVHCKAKQREIRLARQAREEYRNHLQASHQSVVGDEARSPTGSLRGQDLDIPSPVDMTGSLPQDSPDIDMADDAANDWAPIENYIQYEWHPHSKQNAEIVDLATGQRFDKITRQPTKPKSPPSRLNLSPANADYAPWAPFPTESDFEFAERVATSHMTESDITKELNFWLRKAIHTEGALKMHTRTVHDVQNFIQSAIDIHTTFEEFQFTLPMPRENDEPLDVTFSVWALEGMEWIRELLADPALSHEWEWYPKRITQVVNGVATRVWDTSCMSGNAAWAMQDKLDDHQVQIPILVYSDKTNAARFSQHTVWPVVAKLGNLPMQLHNQNSAYAGSTMIGYLPKVPAHLQNQCTVNAWPTFQRQVYHQALEYILKPFVEIGDHGWTMECGDKQVRTAVPTVPIIAQDYEEQCLSALCLGPHANHPCPRCLVHKSMLSDLRVKSKLRNPEDMKIVVAKAQKHIQCGEAAEAIKVLRSSGIYSLPNAWWSLQTNVYQALSFDTLHTLALGLWGGHFWKVLKEVIEHETGSHGLQKLDQRASQVPRFPNLPTLRFLSKIDFTDGDQHWHVLQRILPLVHNIVPPKYRPLLKAIRLLSQIYVLATFSHQTSSRIAAGRGLINQFSDLLPEVGVLCDKNFNFPKIHYLQHLFDDIENKGSARLYTTKPGEGFHVGLIDAYHASNKKNVATHLLHSERSIHALSRIRWLVDDYNQMKIVTEEGMQNNISLQQPTLTPNQHYKLGSPEKPTTAQALKTKQEMRYQQLHRRILQYITADSDLCTDDVTHTLIKVVEHKLLYIQYTSMDDGSQGVDLIRCNPNFHGVCRFDTVMVNTEYGVSFAQLQLLLHVEVCNRSWDLAQVAWFLPAFPRSADQVVGQKRLKCGDEPVLIGVDTVIRACWLQPTNDDPHDQNGPGRFTFVNDLQGTDMYLRLNQATMK